jgi:hypothetical protein
MFYQSVLKSSATVPLLVFAISLTGCSRGSSGQNSVSGVVTQGGQPVAGSVLFIDSANKEYASPIAPDGKYFVQNLPNGPMKVLVKGMPAVAPGPKTKVPISSIPTNSGVTPNSKYATATGGLTFTVTGGGQSFDIDLK